MNSQGQQMCFFQPSNSGLLFFLGTLFIDDWRCTVDFFDCSEVDFSFPKLHISTSGVWAFAAVLWLICCSLLWALTCLSVSCELKVKRPDFPQFFWCSDFLVTPEHIVAHLSHLSTAAPSDVLASPVFTLQPVDWTKTLASLQVDKTVGEVSWATPGTRAGMAMLESFIDVRLKLFGTQRNDPNRTALSQLSPWIRFGQ